MNGVKFQVMYSIRTILRCKVCGSYDIIKHAGIPLRFKCRTCGNTFSFNVQHPLYKKHGKRLSDREKASIAADYRVGIPVSHIMKDHSVSYGTVMRAVRYFERGRRIYLWNIMYMPRTRPRDWEVVDMDIILPEIEAGRLRQGWGIEDLREGPDAFYRAVARMYPEEIDPEYPRQRSSIIKSRYDALKLMLLMKPGDYVIVPRLGRWRERFLVIAEVSGGYEFDGPYFFGHHVRIGRTKVFALESRTNDPEEIAEGYDHDFQVLWHFLRSWRLYRPLERGASVVDRRNRELYRVVNRIMG